MFETQRQKQIKQITKKIQEIWLKNPDFRFFQLLSNCFLSEGEALPNFFYYQDKNLMKFLEEFNKNKL